MYLSVVCGLFNVVIFKFRYDKPSVPSKVKNLQNLIRQICSHIFGLQRVNFIEILRFVQIACGIGQLLYVRAQI